jgi:large conductance mechanosensitive channel
MGMLQEFKSFALRGNVIDLAVAVIIGAAFSGVVNTLVSEMVMPPIGAVASNVDFKDVYIGLWSQKDIDQKVAEKKLPALEPGQRYSLAQVKEASLPYIGYGALITAIINFLIVAFCVFLLVKGANYLARTANVTLGPPPPEAPPQEKLLAEIRDLLKARPL